MISVTQPLGADANDPAAFLSESVHEIFDEYYSVSLSFWTKMGLREKARQGKLTGSLPWGYVKGEDGIAVPDPVKAPFVRRLYEMYASGQHTDRTLAEWLKSTSSAPPATAPLAWTPFARCSATPPMRASPGRREAQSRACTNRSWTRRSMTGCRTCAGSAPAR